MTISPNFPELTKNKSFILEQKEIPNIAERRGTIMTIVPDFEDDDVFEASNEKIKSNESIFNERLSNLPENFEKVRPSIGIKLERISSSGSLEDEESSTENRSSETEPVSISRGIALEKDSCKNSKTNVKNDSSTESFDSALGSNSPSSTKSITKVSWPMFATQWSKMQKSFCKKKT